MGKHLSFWIGFFAAALLVVPIALGVMGVAEERLRQMAVVLFAGVSVLVVLLVVALFFRDAILRRVLGRSEVALEDVAGSLVSAVAAASEGDRDKAAAHARALVQGGVGWYTWSSFYRWVIGSALGLLLAFGAFVGTVLLFEQTRTLRVQTERIGEQTELFARQNELMATQTELMQAQTERLREQTEAAAMQNEILTLSLVNQLREQLLASVETRPLGEWLATLGEPGIDAPLVSYSGERTSCALGFDLEYPLSGPPSVAAIGAVTGLGQSAALGDQVVTALKLLARDTHGSVALGAVLALEVIGQPFEDAIVLRDMFLVETTHLIARNYDLTLRRSYVFQLRCPACDVLIGASVYLFNIPMDASGGSSLLMNALQNHAVNGVHVSPSALFPGDWPSRKPVRLDAGPYFPGSWNAWVTRHKDLPACEIMTEIARINPLLKMMPFDPT